MKKIKLNVVVGMLLLNLIVPAYALSICPVDFTFASSSSKYWDRIKNAISSSNSSVDSHLQKQIKDTTALIVEGRRVLVAQESASSQEIAHGIGQNTEQQIAIENALNTAKAIDDTKREYGHLSTGFDNCQVIKQRQKIVSIGEKTAKQAIIGSQDGTITARSGHYADQSKALANRLAIHDKKYCTQDQAESGLCSTIAPRAGLSLMASTLFKPANQGDDTDQDKNALINNMVGLPDNPIPAKLANTALGIAYQDTKRQKDSLKSIAIYALKYLQAQSTSGTQIDHDHDHDHSTPAPKEQDIVKNNGSIVGSQELSSDQDLSYSGLVAKDVYRHFGGGQVYIDRKKYLSSATEKGILVEMNKATGLQKKLLADLIEKEQIKLSLIAGQTVGMMRYTGMDSKVEKKRQEIIQAKLQGLANAQ